MGEVFIAFFKIILIKKEKPFQRLAQALIGIPMKEPLSGIPSTGPVPGILIKEPLSESILKTYCKTNTTAYYTQHFLEIQEKAAKTHIFHFGG